MSPFELVVILLLVVYSISLHELAHAWVATWCGDPTPGRHGRLTWNPIAHLKPFFFAIVLPIISFFYCGWPIGFASTPVDPSRYRRPLRDSALTGLAGPLTNVLLAFAFLGLLWVPQLADPPKPNCRIFFGAASFNLFLAAFNMLPLPGLDGYEVLRPLLSLNLRSKLDQVRRMGLLPMLIIFLLGPRLIAEVWWPVFDAFTQLAPSDAVAYVQKGLG